MKNSKRDMEICVQTIMGMLAARGIGSRYDKQKNEIITDKGQIIVPVIGYVK